MELKEQYPGIYNRLEENIRSLLSVPKRSSLSSFNTVPLPTSRTSIQPTMAEIILSRLQHLIPGAQPSERKVVT